MDEIEIEVFRADTRASRGITAADIAQVAAFDCAANPVPNVLGHPAGDKPAIKHVTKFRADGSSLFATIPKAATKIWDGIRDGSILNRSIAFFDPNHESNPTPGKWAPRHLGWLGAAAPGIPGLPALSETVKSLAFAADGETLDVLGPPADAIVFSSTPTTVHTVFEAKETAAMEKTPEQIAAETALAERVAAQDAREAAFAARETSTFESGNAALVNGLVAAGKVLPADVAALSLVFNALGRDELTFSATDKSTPAIALAKFLGDKLPKAVPLGERQSPAGEFEAGDKPLTAAQFNAKAEKIAKDKSITFEAAAEELNAALEAA